MDLFNHSNWFKDLSIKINERNANETYPYEDIFIKYQKIWAKSVYLDNKRIDLKHKLSLLEYETSEYYNKQDFTKGVYNTIQRIRKIQEENLPFDSYSYDGFIKSDLIRTVRDQRKLILDQNEEISISKSERNVMIEKILNLENELKLLRKENNLFHTEMDSIQIINIELNNKIQSLEFNNKELLQRIIDEKDKTAQQINEMNSLVDGEIY